MSSAPEPISLEEAKANLRVDITDDDGLISGLIVTAREYIESEYDLVLTPRSVTETARKLGSFIELVSWPVSAITVIRYPLVGVMTPITGTPWLVSFKKRPVRLLPAAPGWGVDVWSTGCQPALPIEIDIEAGFADPADVPQTIKQAMHLLITHWYTNRSAAEVGARAVSVAVDFGVKALLERRWRLQKV